MTFYVILPSFVRFLEPVTRKGRVCCSRHLLVCCVVSAEEGRPKDCWKVIDKNGQMSSGVYHVYIGRAKAPVQVYCDQKTKGGGWLVVTSHQLLCHCLHTPARALLSFKRPTRPHRSATLFAILTWSRVTPNASSKLNELIFGTMFPYTIRRSMLSFRTVSYHHGTVPTLAPKLRHRHTHTHTHTPIRTSVSLWGIVATAKWPCGESSCVQWKLVGKR